MYLGINHKYRMCHTIDKKIESFHSFNKELDDSSILILKTKKNRSINTKNTSYWY